MLIYCPDIPHIFSVQHNDSSTTFSWYKESKEKNQIVFQGKTQTKHCPIQFPPSSWTHCPIVPVPPRESNLTFTPANGSSLSLTRNYSAYAPRLPVTIETHEDFGEDRYFYVDGFIGRPDPEHAWQVLGLLFEIGSFLTFLTHF